MVHDRLASDESCTQWQAINEIAPKLGISRQSLRRWSEQALIGHRTKSGGDP